MASEGRPERGGGGPSCGPAGPRWYRGLPGSLWIALAILSAAWMLDTYETQIFNITRIDLLSELLRLPPGDPGIKFWGEIFLGLYLVGGAVGGTYFGSLADRIGRRPALIITILVFTVFSGVIGLAQSAWQVAVCRFIVALGSAGAWAVGAPYIAEVFPARSRAQASAVFHSSGSLGTWVAGLVGVVLGANWRVAYFLGVVPIVLVFAVQAGIKESKSWQDSVLDPGASRGSLKELLLSRTWGVRAILGMLIAGIGLGTFWCLNVGGQDLVQEFLARHGIAGDEARSRARFAYGFLIAGGSLLGVISFGPIAQKFGRRRSLGWALAAAALVIPATWYLPRTYGQLLLMLPLYGYITNGFHAVFAVYFPELFPTHLRATGAGFCFNGGRLLAAAILVSSAWIKSVPGLELRAAACILAVLYLAGIGVTTLLPETKNEDLAAVP